MKAIASRLQSISSHSSTCSTPERLSARSEGDIRSKACSQKLTQALHELKATSPRCDVIATAKHVALTSPCFFHRRFDDAVNIDKVLEEIAGDESMSHSKLVHTAIGVREVSKQLQRRPIKRAVKTVLIVTKARDNNLVSLTRDLTEWLLRTPRYGSPRGVTVYVDEKLRNSKRFNASGLLAQDIHFEHTLKYWTSDLCWSSPEKIDLVLTLGGDGTVLFTSWLFQRIVPPILSFSLGSLGFLTPFDFAHYRERLNQVMGGTPGGFQATSIPSTPTKDGALNKAPEVFKDVVSDAGMRVNLRMRFTCTVFRNHQSSRPSNMSGNKFSPLQSAVESEKFEVLNELVIDRGPSPYVSNLELFGDDTLLTVIQADGVIFSTPTGSTAYSLSAGGSLVHPDIPAILLTPICPHTLSFRPMLLNDTMALRIAVPRASRATAYCSFDGKGRIELRQGDYVTITASKYPFPTVVGGKLEWIDSVSRTLRWNTREAQQKGWGNAMRDARRLSSCGEIAEPGAAADVEVERLQQEADDFDIDIDEEETADSRDSGYEGDMASSTSPAGANEGESSPAWRKLSHLDV